MIEATCGGCNVKMTDSINKLYISMYHYTRDLVHNRYPGIKGMDMENLEESLKEQLLLEQRDTVK